VPVTRRDVAGGQNAGRQTTEAVMTEQAVMEPTTTAVTGPEDQNLVAGDSRLADEEALVAEELLVEEVSIDGMCGVY
jgi:mycofactocin precursor